MKTLFIVLIIFNIALDYNCTPHKSISNLKLENPSSIPDYSERNIVKNQKTDPGLNQIDMISHVSPQILAREYKKYDQPVRNSVETLEGQTYIGTKNGIRLDAYLLNIWITTDNSHIPEDHVTAMALDDHNNLWIGTYSAGIVIGIGKHIKPYKSRAVQTHDLDIANIFCAGGHVWVTYRNGGYECFQNEISIAYFPSPS